MGTLYQVTCISCGHRTESAKGKDRGLIAIKKPMVCNTCVDVVQVLIEFDKDTPKYKELINGDEVLEKYVHKNINICQRCSLDNIEDWDHSTCPKCKGGVEFSPEPSFIWE